MCARVLLLRESDSVRLSLGPIEIRYRYGRARLDAVERG